MNSYKLFTTFPFFSCSLVSYLQTDSDKKKLLYALENHIDGYGFEFVSGAYGRLYCPQRTSGKA